MFVFHTHIAHIRKKYFSPETSQQKNIQRYKKTKNSCNTSNIFQAAASVSGIVEIRPGNQEGLAICDAEVTPLPFKTAVLNVHGTLDPLGN